MKGLLSGIGLAAGIVVAACAVHAETIVEIPGPDGPLQGVMLTAGPPEMVIIPGSGPTDRDGNGPYGLRAATYKLLADGLAERGVSTLRIDKRGMYGSAAAVPDADDVTIADYAADVRAWVAMLRRTTGASCVWLLGHSEGGLVALVAAQRAQDICGLVLVAAPGRPLSEVLREQLISNPANGPVLDQALDAIATLAAGRRFDDSHLNGGLRPLFGHQAQRFLISAFSYDPPALLRSYDKPVLVLQGESDRQVTTLDAHRLKEADPAATLVLLPGVDHVLKSAGSSDSEASFMDPNLPLADGVINVVAAFVLRPQATH